MSREAPAIAQKMQENSKRLFRVQNEQVNLLYSSGLMDKEEMTKLGFNDI